MAIELECMNLSRNANKMKTDIRASTGDADSGIWGETISELIKRTVYVYYYIKPLPKSLHSTSVLN
jgi:hypothetical protein